MFILRWLWFWKKPTLKSLQSESLHVESIFMKTKQQCLKVNEKIDVLVAKKQQAIQAQQSEVSTLLATATKNSKLASKMDTFIEE